MSRPDLSSTPAPRHRRTKPLSGPSASATASILVLGLCVAAWTIATHFSPTQSEQALAQLSQRPALTPSSTESSSTVQASLSLPRSIGPTPRATSRTVSRSLTRTSLTPAPSASATPSIKPSLTPNVPSATPTPSAPQSPAPSTPATPAKSLPVAATAYPGMSATESEVIRLTNVERAKVGCSALRPDAQLALAGRRHSADMAARNYFSHNSLDGRTFVARIDATAYTGSAGGENIAAGQSTPAAVMSGWMKSPGHKANILDCSFKALGVGVATGGTYGIYWTQDFGR